jgi:lipoteichoic acid synthase
MRISNYTPKSVLAFLAALLSLQLSFQGIIIGFESFSQLVFIVLFSLQFGLITALFPTLVWPISSKVSEWISIILCSFVLFTHFLLLLYLDQTGILLGADLFGYSLSDITHTVESSSSFSLMPWLILIFSFILFFGIRKWVQFKSGSILFFVLLGLGVFATLLPSNPPVQSTQSEAYFYKTKNPSSHFWNKTLKLVSDKFFSPEQSSKNFPFLRPIVTENALSKWIDSKENPPHIIIIAVEGLGSDFVSAASKYGGATPFLDSLAKESLYWPNCLSNTGRTFGILPSLTASLPYGNTGFMDLKDHMPNHYSLFSLLKPSYRTSFFYGGNASFDNQSLFLRYQGINYLGDESVFPKDWSKLPGNEEGFSWGYGDKELFQLGLEKLKSFPRKPKLSFFMTITTHEPFVSPEPEYLEVALANVKNEATLSEYPGVFTCLAYTDDAIRRFINDYSQTEDYQNSIIIITGDHRLIPVPAGYRFDRFKVPLIVHSPLIKKPIKSENIITHSQVFPSLLGYMQKNFEMNFPEKISSIAPAIKADSAFGSQAEIALMRNKNEMEEYISGKYLLSGEGLFEIGTDFQIRNLENDSIKNELKIRLKQFAQDSKNAIEKNQLVAEKDFQPNLQFYSFTREEKQTLDKLFKDEQGLDTLYFKALDLAHSQQYQKSEILIKYGLNQDPDYSDFQVLLARVYAWQGQYDSALQPLHLVMQRTENFEDAYVAFADIYFWDQKPDKSSEWVERGLKIFPQSLPLLIRNARNLFVENQKEEARIIMDSILNQDPDNEIALQLKSWFENANAQ